MLASLTDLFESPAGNSDCRERRNAPASESRGSVSEDRALRAGLAAGDALAE